MDPLYLLNLIGHVVFSRPFGGKWTGFCFPREGEMGVLGVVRRKSRIISTCWLVFFLKNRYETGAAQGGASAGDRTNLADDFRYIKADRCVVLPAKSNNVCFYPSLVACRPTRRN